MAKYKSQIKIRTKYEVGEKKAKVGGEVDVRLNDKYYYKFADEYLIMAMHKHSRYMKEND